MNEKEQIEILIRLAELEMKHRASNKSVVEKVSDGVVDVIEAPFKIAGRLMDDIFG